MNIKIGDIVKSDSGGYGPVLEIYQGKEKLLYWIDFKYGYDLTHEGLNHKMWAGDVTLMIPGEASVTRPCPICGGDMSHLSIQAKTCSSKCRKALSRKCIASGQEAIIGVSETSNDLNITKADEIYGVCLSCGSKFLVRCAWDDVRCDDCYQADVWMNDEDYGPWINGEEAHDPETEYDQEYCSGCNCPHHSCACLPF